jgi:hypothetical protein
MIISKNGIKLREGQIWSIGKTTKKNVEEINGVSDIGTEVEIIGDFLNGLFKAKSVKNGVRFDLEARNLGKLIR